MNGWVAVLGLEVSESLEKGVLQHETPVVIRMFLRILLGRVGLVAAFVRDSDIRAPSPGLLAARAPRAQIPGGRQGRAATALWDPRRQVRCPRQPCRESPPRLSSEYCHPHRSAPTERHMVGEWYDQVALMLGR